MKTKKFIKEIRSMGFDVKELHYNLAIYDDNEFSLAHVSKKEVGVLITDFPCFYKLEHNSKLQLLNLLIEYAKTPIEDRKEEEKYYYRLKGFNTLIDKYLARGKISNDFYLVSQYEKEDYNTQFTDKEFEVFPDDIKSHNWEKIKVERVRDEF